MNDPGLCEMSIEYENLRMDIEVMERMLAQVEEIKDEKRSQDNID